MRKVLFGFVIVVSGLALVSAATALATGGDDKVAPATGAESTTWEAPNGGRATDADPTAGDVGATRALVGDNAEFVRFVPINPCRLVDTRVTAALAPNATREFNVDGGGPSISAQGGSASCVIPFEATATDVNITAVDPTNTGFVRMAPADGDLNATVLNYLRGFNPTNGTSVPHCPSKVTTTKCAAANGSESEIKVKNFGGTTDIVIDAVGYWAPRDQFAMIEGQATPAFAEVSRGLTTVVRLGTGTYRLTWADPVIDCAPNVTVEISGLNATVDTVRSGGVSNFETSIVIVSESGTATNAEFYVSVTC